MIIKMVLIEFGISLGDFALYLYNKRQIERNKRYFLGSIPGEWFHFIFSSLALLSFYLFRLNNASRNFFRSYRVKLERLRLGKIAKSTRIINEVEESRGSEDEKREFSHGLIFWRVLFSESRLSSLLLMILVDFYYFP
jgi:hypothetical protein